MSSLEFVCGPNNNFNALVDSFREHIICFGVPGKEILLNRRFLPEEPTIDDVDLKGKRKYALVKSSADELTDAADRRFCADLAFWRDMFSRYQKDSQELVVYILSRLSIASKLALSTYTHVDTGFEACKARVDHFGLWDLVLKTHLYGSGARTKQRFMVELLSCKQSGSHEAFIGDIRARMKLVVGAFTKKEAPDSIKVDDLLKCIYINGLDQVYFDRPINRLVEDMPNAMRLCPFVRRSPWKEVHHLLLNQLHSLGKYC